MISRTFNLTAWIIRQAGFILLIFALLAGQAGAVLDEPRQNLEEHSLTCLATHGHFSALRLELGR